MAAARADTRTASFIQVGMATTWPHLLPPLAAEEIPASIHYGAAERSNMKKQSGNAASKPAKTSSAEFLNGTASYNSSGAQGNDRAARTGPRRSPSFRAPCAKNGGRINGERSIGVSEYWSVGIGESYSYSSSNDPAFGLDQNS